MRSFIIFINHGSHSNITVIIDMLGYAYILRAKNEKEKKKHSSVFGKL